MVRKTTLLGVALSVTAAAAIAIQRKQPDISSTLPETGPIEVSVDPNSKDATDEDPDTETDLDAETDPDIDNDLAVENDTNMVEDLDDATDADDAVTEEEEEEEEEE